MDNKILLDVRHLRKGYKKMPVLRDVSFQLKQGRILGLIGKNGAGKTTLMKSILGLNAGFQGEVYFQGKKFSPADEAAKSQIGSLVDVSFYDDMTAYENLEAAMMLGGSAAVCRKARILELLQFAGLDHVRNRSVRSFSFGMKQRLALAQAIITEPALLILDEPFVGLDPVGMEEVKDLLRSLCNKKGTAIIFSSHQLAEVSDLADDIVVLNDGVIQYSGTRDNLEKSGKSLIELMR